MELLKRLRDPFNVTPQDAAEAADEIERLREALQSIANNTCCDKCQEAARRARFTLGEEHGTRFNFGR